jgi:ankyrin repeat protein
LPNLIQSEAEEEYYLKSPNLDAGDTNNHFRAYDADCLCDAAKHGDLNLSGTSLRAGVNINARNEQGSALYQACLHSQRNMIHFLCQQGAKVDGDADQDWRTPLIVAVCNNDTDLISQLLTFGSLRRLQSFISGPFSPVRLAIRLDRGRIMEMLSMVRIIDWSVANLNLALEFALETRNVRMIRLFLDAGADFDHSLHNGDTALVVAVEMGDVPMVKLLLGVGAEPNRVIDVKDNGVGIYSHSLLRQAVTEGNIEIVELLLKAGANVNEEHIFDNSNSRKIVIGTALQAACKSNDQELVRLLLTAGAKINALGTSVLVAKTALQTAAAEGHLDLVRALLDAGADINAPAAGGTGMTALQAAVKHGDTEVVQLLLDSGADVNAPAGYFGRTALEAAADYGGYDLVKLLLDAGADANGQDSGSTPLGYAIPQGCRLTTELLLDFHVDVNQRFEYKGDFLLPIQAAARLGRIDLVTLLCERGADINAAAEDDCGRTALQAAVEGGHHEMIHWLLARGAHINAPAAKLYGLTALQAASGSGAFDIVSMLLEKGADVNAPLAETSGLTALQAACRGGALDIVYLLLENGADVNAPPCEDDGYTALEAAAFDGRLDIVRLLLNVGAETIDSGALDYAIIGRHEAVIDVLKCYEF